SHRQRRVYRSHSSRIGLSGVAADDSSHQARAALLQPRGRGARLNRARGRTMYKQLQQRGMDSPPVNVTTLAEMKAAREPIACLTAYDASFAQLVDMAGTDVVLVGDSLGMVIQGHDTTVPVTVDDVIYHCRNVARGIQRAFLMADMPFMSYTSPEQALDNAVRMMQQGGAMMV